MSAAASQVEAGRSARAARLDLAAVAIPVLVGALLCAIELNTRSLWLDEGSTFAIASQHGAALWHGIAHDGGNMLLYYLLIHVVIKLFGAAAWVLRLPSLVADALTGGLVSALGLRLLGDRRAALAGGLLTVISLPLIYWGQDARGYAPMVTLATASMLAYAALAQPSTGRFLVPRTRNLPVDQRRLSGDPSKPTAATVAYVLSTTAMLYVGYDAALLVLAQLALLPLCRERAKHVLGALAAVAVLCIPLALLALARGSGQLFWVPPLSGSVLGQSAVTLLSAGLPPSFHHTVTTLVTAILSGALLLAALAAGVWEARRPAGRRAHRQLWLLLSWLVVPAVVALLASAAGEPIELARCAILLMPALSLLLAWALSHRALPRAAGICAFVVVIGLRVAQVLPSYGVSPEGWKAASAYVLSASRVAPACVAFYPQDGREVFDYYLLDAGGGPAATLTPVLPALSWGTVEPFVERYDTLAPGRLATVAGRCPRLYLVASHIGQRQGPPVSRANLARYRALEAALSRRYPHQRQRVFGWAAPVNVTLYAREA